jgi:hypothetical protein
MTEAGPAGPALDLRGLLTIDVAAELRKLCQAQIQGPWQIPAELVRRAIRAGATSVHVTLGRRQLVVTDDGPGLDPAHLEWITLLVDRQQDDQPRHRALLALEQAGELALLALAGVDDLQDLHIESTRPGTRIALRAPGLDRRKAARWLADVARFSSVPVLIDGSPVADGMTGSLVQAPLAPPLRGRVALVRQGDVAHAYLLSDGLVTAHITIPDAPCFVAAVELGTQGGELTAAGLRDAVMPHVPGLIDQAVALVAVQVGRPAPLSEPTRARLAQLTLQAARRKLRGAEIDRLPLFRTIDSEGSRLVDLAALRASPPDATGSRTLLCLSPDQPPERYALGPEPVLIADDAERSLLAEVLGARFRTPDRRESSRSLAASWRRLLRGARRLLGHWFDLVRHPLRPPLLPDHALTLPERALLAALRAQLRTQRAGGATDAVLCQGQGPLRRTRGHPRVLILPRNNPTVLACVRAFSADPEWMRLISLALLGGRNRSS